jgi:CPA1 family monovalent cation:H+ antiporter
MQSVLILGAILIAFTAIGDAASLRLRTPQSILLVMFGAGLSLTQVSPRVVIDPQLMLLLFLPPLIYSSGVGMSWRGFRNNLRPILLLAIGCVMFTAAAVAVAAHWLLAMPWAVAFVLGAVVSPPDPVAPMAIARRLNMPKRLLNILEGEGVVNDATALILLSFAIAAVSSGRFSLSAAGISFVAIVVGEVLWGIVVGWTLLRIRRWVGAPQVEIMLALLTPFVAFWPPHMLGGSGVLAALAAGLYVSWSGPRFISPATRLQGYFVWGLIVHALEGLLFLLTGLQARMLAAGLVGVAWQRLAFAALVICLVVVLVRFVWVFPATYLPRLLFSAIRRREPNPNWQNPFIIGFTGIRGVISLVAALSIPAMIGGAPFPDRPLILFVTFCVIIVTLVGQGSMLPFLLPKLGLVEAGKAEAADAKAREVKARIEGIDAALRTLDRLEREGAPASAIDGLRRRHSDRRKRYAGTADVANVQSPVAEDAYLQAKLIDAERRKVAELYADSRITDDARRRIERELDLEDARNRHAYESATGDVMADPVAEAQLDQSPHSGG